jgi:hypothetical protein
MCCAGDPGAGREGPARRSRESTGTGRGAQGDPRAASSGELSIGAYRSFTTFASMLRPGTW